MSLDDYKPHMMDELTGGVTIASRATDCLQTVNNCRNILDRIADSLTGNSTKMMLGKPDEIVCSADAVLRILITDMTELESVRAQIEALYHTLERDFERRIADRLQKRNLILYGISVS